MFPRNVLFECWRPPRHIISSPHHKMFKVVRTSWGENVLHPELSATSPEGALSSHASTGMAASPAPRSHLALEMQGFRQADPWRLG